MPDTNIEQDSLTASTSQSFRRPLKARPERLDKVLAKLIPEHSRSRLQGWIEDGHVLVNGSVARVRQMVGPGDEITVWPQVAPEDLAFSPEPVDFQVIDEGDGWIVVFKPAGLVTHPGAGNWSGTLLNGLLYRYPELARVPRAGIVHRLDKDTSGLLVVARTEQAQTHLVRQLQARTVSREYVALVHGSLSSAGRIDLPIGRDARVPVRMSTDRPIAPKPAITHYEPQRMGRLEPGGQVTEVVCRLETGRTHQIRVHMACLGHPLIADVLYGGKEIGGMSRQMLHARALAFDEPGTERRLSFAAPMPPDFVQALEVIQWES
ncbi:MAG TPA: RluA family pseudouridine synthase [Pusillimonas sp.]|uniref:RluA family pseudouridine synthase n=1 Tax=unclassified Pusillimonas TaxID=2640016 RepID=UPI00262535D9|nr:MULTISPECIES: RluA family pseudouridine synthase [unclassified Pusillimonas]HLU20146.1 RluA family pseudouridine synthase [Pusillimonas sp.]